MAQNLFSTEEICRYGIMATSLELRIKTLPPELRDMILKEFIKEKKNDREDRGWGEVHEELGDQYRDEASEKVVTWVKCDKCLRGILKNYGRNCILDKAEIVLEHFNCYGCYECAPRRCWKCSLLG